MPEPAVAESVNVCADQLATEPVVAGVPDFAPEVKFHDTAALETTVVTAAASSVSVCPSQSNPDVSGEMREIGLLRILSNSALRSP